MLSRTRLPLLRSALPTPGCPVAHAYSLCRGCGEVYLGGHVHDVAYSGRLREGQAVQGAGQQVPAAPDAAGCNVCALLHPPHDLASIPEGLATVTMSCPQPLLPLQLTDALCTALREHPSL